MNQRVKSPATAKGRRAWIFLSLLLPAFASKVSTQNSMSPLLDTNPHYPPNTHPYLHVVMPAALRFEDAEPPPDLVARPPAGAPPKPHEKDNAKPDVVLPKPAATAAPAPAPVPAKANEVPAPVTAAPATPAVQTPPPILPDDVPTQVRPEDFLPYFQYPGSARRGRGDAPPPPASPPLPVSTATYTEGQ
jgi:hypothetical protein